MKPAHASRTYLASTASSRANSRSRPGSPIPPSHAAAGAGPVGSRGASAGSALAGSRLGSRSSNAAPPQPAASRGSEVDSSVALDTASGRQTPYPLHLRGAGAITADDVLALEGGGSGLAPQPSGALARGSDDDYAVAASPNDGLRGVDALSPVYGSRVASRRASAREHESSDDDHEVDENGANAGRRVAAQPTAVAVDSRSHAARSQPAAALAAPQKPRSHSGRAPPVAVAAGDETRGEEDASPRPRASVRSLDAADTSGGDFEDDAFDVERRRFQPTRRVEEDDDVDQAGRQAAQPSRGRELGASAHPSSGAPRGGGNGGAKAGAQSGSAWSSRNGTPSPAPFTAVPAAALSAQRRVGAGQASHANAPRPQQPQQQQYGAFPDAAPQGARARAAHTTAATAAADDARSVSAPFARAPAASRAAQSAASAAGGDAAAHSRAQHPRGLTRDSDSPSPEPDAAQPDTDADLAVALKDVDHGAAGIVAMAQALAKSQHHHLRRLARQQLAQKRRHDDALAQLAAASEEALARAREQGDERAAASASVADALRTNVRELTATANSLRGERDAARAATEAARAAIDEAQRLQRAAEQRESDAQSAADAAERAALELTDALTREQSRNRELQRQLMAYMTAAPAPSSSQLATARQSEASAANSRPALASVVNSQPGSAQATGACAPQPAAAASAPSSGTSRPRVFVLTGFEKDARDRITADIRALGGTVVACEPDAPLPPAVTHVVATTHTPKTMCGMLASPSGRVWVVPPAYVQRSAKVRAWGDEAAAGGVPSEPERWRRLFPVVVVPRAGERDGGADEVCRLLSAHGFTLVEDSPSMPSATRAAKRLEQLYHQMRPPFLDATA
jgi:colicin import membrane protein